MPMDHNQRTMLIQPKESDRYDKTLKFTKQSQINKSQMFLLKTYIGLRSDHSMACLGQLLHFTKTNINIHHIYN